jgi:hypothetical protein
LLAYLGDQELFDYLDLLETKDFLLAINQVNLLITVSELLPQICD